MRQNVVGMLDEIWGEAVFFLLTILTGYMPSVVLPKYGRLTATCSCGDTIIGNLTTGLRRFTVDQFMMS